MVRDFSPEELSYLATSFAVSLADGLDEESVKVLCSFFVSVVGSLNLIAAQRKLQCKPCKKKCPPAGKDPPAEEP